MRTLLGSRFTEFPTGVQRNVKPPDLTTHMIKSRSFKQAKDVPPWHAAVKAEYQAAYIAACDSVIDMIVVLLYWFNHECVTLAVSAISGLHEGRPGWPDRGPPTQVGQSAPV